MWLGVVAVRRGDLKLAEAASKAAFAHAVENVGSRILYMYKGSRMRTSKEGEQLGIPRATTLSDTLHTFPGRSTIFPPKWSGFPSNTYYHVLACIRAVLALIHVL